MKRKSLIDKIDTILKKDRGCMCGSFESCEVCNSYSSYNKLRKEIRETIHGPDYQPTIEDYGRSMEITAMWFDEFGEINRDIFEALDGRNKKSDAKGTIIET